MNADTPERNLSKAIIKAVGGSLLFWENEIMYITKHINGEWICKEGHKDPNYAGNRYIWKDETQ